MTPRIATVLGGTGFLGRRIVRHLHRQGFAVRIASRHLHRSRDLFGVGDPRLVSIDADIHNEQAVSDAVGGAFAVVNAVSLYLEHGKATFHSVHVDGARRVAAAARQAGVERFVQVSGIGADASSESPYIRSRGQGESAVRGAFPGAVVIRPAVMFGPDDAFVSVILELYRRFRACPMFGIGSTKLQPVDVEDVAEAIARILQPAHAAADTFECGGPRVYSYRELLRTIAAEAGLRPFLFPVPFAVWHTLAHAAEFLPNPPVTRNQVELMRVDNVASPQLPGLAELGITPQTIPAHLSGEAGEV
jgi:uncharacterized protein YbjT (DUF2867 family)